MAVRGDPEQHATEMTAYAPRDGEDTILVDPLVAGETEPLLAVLDEIFADVCRSSSPLPSTCAAPSVSM
jgi:hypothetical protein